MRADSVCMRTLPKGDLQRTHALLVGQLLACASVAGVLLGVMPSLAAASADAACVWLFATTLHALASLRLVGDAVDYLNLDCPACHQSVHGFPEHLPRFSRRHCASCGIDFAQADAGTEAP